MDYLSVNIADSARGTFVLSKDIFELVERNIMILLRAEPDYFPHTRMGGWKHSVTINDYNRVLPASAKGTR
jgi:hypothetical protein